MDSVIRALDAGAGFIDESRTSAAVVGYGASRFSENPIKILAL